MGKRIWGKWITLISLLLLIVSSTVPNFALAEEKSTPKTATPTTGATDGGTSANDTTRSMITFFKENRTSIAVDSVSKDELMVYGIFMSNFFIPWSTTVKDIIDDNGKGSIPKTISNKFFGSEGKASQIVDINKKLHEPIRGTLADNKEDFALYNSAPKDGDNPLTGKQLYKKMAGKGKYLYNKSGKKVLDMSKPEVQASFQILFSYKPKYFLAKDKGLRAITGIYMDGLGNIWGSYDKASADDFVLILPASLNPAVFADADSNKNYSKGKFPMNNVFSMGATLNVTSDFLSGGNPTFPYYNVNKKFPSSASENVASVFGVQSALDFLGKSDSIVSGKTSSDLASKVKTFTKQNGDANINEQGAKIVLSMDMSKASGIDDMLKTSYTDLSKKETIELVNYLAKTKVISIDNIADYLYTFDMDAATTDNATAGKSSWSDHKSLINKQKLFAIEGVTKEGDPTGKYYFHGKSYYNSPFTLFLYKYYESEDKDAYLKKVFPNITDKKMKKDEYKALKKFLDGGTFGGASTKTINKALELMKFDNDLVYGTVEPAKSITKVRVDEIAKGFIYTYDEPTTFALSANDINLTMMSASATMNGFKNFFTTFDDTSKKPFGFGTFGKGGKINGNSKTNVNQIASYFHNAYSYRIFSMNRTFLQGVGNSGEAVSTAHKTPWEKSSKSENKLMNGVNHYPGIYWGYLVDMLDVKWDKKKEEWTSSEFSNSLLPYMTINTTGGGLDLNSSLNEGGLAANDEQTLKEMQEDIIKKVYGLVSEESNVYRDNIIKAAQDSFIIQTHRAITGSWAGNQLSISSGGNSSYASTVGYINTPDLGDIPLTQKILESYTYVYMLCLLLILIALILMVITSLRSFRQGVVIFIFMSFVLLLPQFLVGGVINMSNKVGDEIYSGRFNYWAITQHQQSLSNLDSFKVTGNEVDYLIANNMEKAKNVYSDAGVRLRWMSPKKDDMFDSLFSKKGNKMSDSLTANTTLFRWLFNSYLNQEEYVYDDPLATYVYRPYNAIAQDASNSYSQLAEETVVRKDVAKDIEEGVAGMLNVPENRFDFITSSERNVEYPKDQKKLINKVRTYSLATEDDEKNKENSYRFWALNSPDLTKSIFSTSYDENPGYTGDTTNKFYNAYSLTTESPFYYFYNLFNSKYGNMDGSFNSALLVKDVFKTSGTGDRDVDGTMRDFLDLEGLFTYVIPYMKQGNDYVYEWRNINGSGVDTFDFSIESGAPTADDDPELFEKYSFEKNKKEALKGVWKLYTPWVDQLYSLDVYNKKTTVARDKVLVSDIINPANYDAVGRPMIFSESDMYAKSYTEADLTDIEKRIQRTLDGTYEDLMYLTNYYDFKPEVVVTTAAMMATFNFNREFSDPNYLGESVNQYPQNFELKNFNYDAFMRLLLLNATGEPLTTDDNTDLYERILKKTSIFTGLLLIICDLLAVILIPSAKVIILMLLFFLSILVAVTCVLVQPTNLVKTVLKVLGLPSILFLIASGLFSFVISLFMGEGLTGYVGGRLPELDVSDPTVTMVLVVFADCVYLFVLWKIFMMLLKGFKTYSLTAFNSYSALVADAGTTIVGNIKNGPSKVFGSSERSNTSSNNGSNGGSSGNTSGDNDRASTSDSVAGGTSTAYGDSVVNSKGLDTSQDLLDTIENNITKKTGKNNAGGSENSTGKDKTTGKQEVVTTQADITKSDPNRSHNDYLKAKGSMGGDNGSGSSYEKENGDKLHTPDSLLESVNSKSENSSNVIDGTSEKVNPKDKQVIERGEKLSENNKDDKFTKIDQAREKLKVSRKKEALDKYKKQQNN